MDSILIVIEPPSFRVSSKKSNDWQNLLGRLADDLKDSPEVSWHGLGCYEIDVRDGLTSFLKIAQLAKEYAFNYQTLFCESAPKWIKTNNEN